MAVPQEFEGIKKFLSGLDARAYTTPLGAILGLAAVRSMAPKSKRNWKTYGLGAAGGAGAGFVAGTGIEAMRGSGVEEEVPDTEEPVSGVDKSLSATPKPAGGVPPLRPPAPPAEDKPEVQRAHAVAITSEQQDSLNTVRTFMKTQERKVGAADPVRSKKALPLYYNLMPIESGLGLSWYSSAKPTREERATALAAEGGLPELSTGQKATTLFKALFGSTAYSLNMAPRPMGETDRITVERDQLADKAREYRGSKDPAKQAHYRSMAKLLRFDYNNSMEIALTYQKRREHLEGLLSNSLGDMTVRSAQKRLYDEAISELDNQISSENKLAVNKAINMHLWRYPGVSFIGAFHPGAALIQMGQEGDVNIKRK